MSPQLLTMLAMLYSLLQELTFDCIVAQVVSGMSADHYHIPPSSVVVTAVFFDELSTILDCVADARDNDFVIEASAFTWNVRIGRSAYTTVGCSARRPRPLIARQGVDTCWVALLIWRPLRQSRINSACYGSGPIYFIVGSGCRRLPTACLLRQSCVAARRYRHFTSHRRLLVAVLERLLEEFTWMGSLGCLTRNLNTSLIHLPLRGRSHVIDGRLIRVVQP